MHKTCWRGLRSLFGWTPLVAMVLFVSIDPVLSQTLPLGVPSDAILEKNQSRIALVIGNSAYTDMNALANPANDADDVAGMLEMLGFEVKLLLKTDYAAKLCVDLVVSKDGIVYDDWFLPSAYDLHEMYEKLKKNNLGGFSDEAYWSSSGIQYSDVAWYKDFYRGSWNEGRRVIGLSVRPVRAF